LKGSRIEQALRTKLAQTNRLALQEYVQSLPEAEPEGDEAAGAGVQASAAQAAGTE
jgi:hypothetical protein